jgi:lysophospholipase L1-like esterase
MKPQRLMSALVGLVLAVGACASPGTGDTGTGGSSSGGSNGTGGSQSGGATGSGGTTGNGGSGQSGGTTGTGGTTGKGGATGSGGSGQSGGTTGTGGTIGTGGVTGTGGSGQSGGTTGAGGNASGGTTGAGGSGQSGGTTGTGGKGGSTGTGGSGQSGGTTGTGGSGSGGTGSGGSGGGSGTQKWVGTWTAAPYVDTNSNNAPPISLSNSVIRQVAHVSLGGSQIRVQFSNLDGTSSLVINSAHIALCGAAAGALVDSTINTSTDKALMFSGAASVTVAAGKEAWSDPIAFDLANQGNLTITTALGSVPSTLTQHSGSRTTSYFQSGSTTVNAANMTSAKTAVLWFFISAIDVMADSSAKGTVAIGDSITDGRGTDTDGEDRWTDILAARLQANPPTANVSMMNVGIGGTNLIGTTGTAAQARFKHDVLGQDGVHYVIVLEGVNDIAGGASAAQLESAYMDLISRAHAQSLVIYGGTITPFGGDTTGSPTYYTAAHEMVRQQVNTWIKTAGNFDGYIDFDAAITDNGNPPKIQAQYAAWSQMDGLHPGPAGYKAMGNEASLTLFTK